MNPVERGGRTPKMDRTQRSGGPAKTGSRKFVAEDVVRRDLTPEEMERPRYVNSQLRFLLEKNRDSLPRLEGLWPGLSEETHERWRRSWRQDMEELGRIGRLRAQGKMDEAGEGVYADLLVVLRWAVPMLIRLGLAPPSVPLEVGPGRDGGRGKDSQEAQPMSKDKKKMIPLRAPKEVPEGMIEEEAREFWGTHEIAEEYLKKAGLPTKDVLPHVRYVRGIGAVAGAGAEERERLKREHPRLFGELALVLARRDPVGLVRIGAPEDEYVPEVGTILPRLGAVISEGEALNVVHEEFVRWFGPEVAGPRERYAETASEIWRIWTIHDPR